MFSNNRKISSRQAVRLLIMDIFTGACLFLPMALPRVAGYGGLLACLLGLALTWTEGFVISKCMEQCGSHYIPLLGNRWGGSILRWFYGIRCLAAYVFLMSMFSGVLRETFLYTMPKWLIIAAMMLVLIYGSIKGIEVRARLSEILFYLILIPIFIIGLFSLPEAEWSRLWTFSGLTFQGILQGTLVTWVLMTPVEWMLYIAPENPGGRAINIFNKAIAIGGALVLAIYIFCLVVLDVSGMAAERWPTVILMQIVKIPGGFLSRQDGLMLSFWIFAMFISLSGALSHAVELLRRDGMKITLPRCAAIAVAGAVLSYIVGMDVQFMHYYFYGMIISGIFLLWILPLILSFFEKKNKKKKALLLMTIILAGTLLGCENYVELENRDFVMAIGVDQGENAAYCFTYAFPDLAELTGNGGGEKAKPLTIEAESLDDAEEEYNRMSEKRLDYGQVKVIVWGDALLADKQEVSMLIEEMFHKQELSRTVLMCRSYQSAEELIKIDEKINGSIGIYLEELFKNHQREIILNDFTTEIMSEELPEVIIQNERIALCEPDR